MSWHSFVHVAIGITTTGRTVVPKLPTFGKPDFVNEQCSAQIRIGGASLPSLMAGCSGRLTGGEEGFQFVGDTIRDRAFAPSTKVTRRRTVNRQHQPGSALPRPVHEQISRDVLRQPSDPCLERLYARISRGFFGFAGMLGAVLAGW
jgi:hypothetical protein